MSLRLVSLFAGIGGLDLGLEASLGAEVVAQVEIDEYCRSILARQWPDAIQVADVRGAIPQGLRCDVLCGGFPCQPHSVAGLRRGIDDERHLWPEMVRWIVALAPRLAIIENVPGLLTSSGGEVFSQVLSDLHAAGYDVRWRAISASEVGAPHRRRRIFLVATRSGAEPLRLPPASSMRAAWGHTGWPSRPSEPQRAHEPPRVAATVPQRRHRLRALGNAVVPHCAYAVGMWARVDAAAEGGVLAQFSNGRRLSRNPSLFDRDEAPPPKWPSHGMMVAGKVRECTPPLSARAGELWPTATAGDAKGTTPTDAVPRDWPTPRASESEMRTYAPCPSHDARTHGRILQAEVIAFDGDPTAPAPGQKRAEIGALNPEWVELLMGFPPRWTVAAVRKLADGRPP